jgi:uncharacterized protein
MKLNVDVPGPISLLSIMGSKAYGLDTPDSDTDYRGIYVAPTDVVLGLNPPKDTIDGHDPDVVVQEVGKFIRLALAANPTILEMLFMPSYLELDDIGADIIASREAFLSQRAAVTFGGYAKQQIERLQRRNDGSFAADTRKRTAKHARHCFRLFHQGRELLETGKITVNVGHMRDELFAIGEAPVEEMVARFEREWATFNQIESVLPEQPDMEMANRLLLSIRHRVP